MPLQLEPEQNKTLQPYQTQTSTFTAQDPASQTSGSDPTQYKLESPTSESVSLQSIMSGIKYGSPSGGIKEFGEKSYYSQYVDLGNGIVKASGQGGWSIEGGPLGGIPDNAKDQVEAAFMNVDHVLKAAGLAGVQDVYLVRSYHTDINETMQLVTEAMKRHIPLHRPIWTAIGTTQLGHPSMKIEIEVEAKHVD